MDKLIKGVDKLCAENKVTRVDVLCALIRAFIEKARLSRKKPKSSADLEAVIRKAIGSRHSCTIRELKRVTHSKHTSSDEWDKALQALCRTGELSVADEKTLAGRTRKMVTLSVPENGKL